MSDPFMGEIKLVAFSFAPKGWAFCSGQVLPINQNQALFALLGTTYGGDGQINFALPNLAGRTLIGYGNGPLLGEAGGEQTHTLTSQELPAHVHGVYATTHLTDNVWGPGSLIAATNANAYAPQLNNAMNPATISNVGGSQPHANMQPYLVLNYIIALQGVFPSQN